MLCAIVVGRTAVSQTPHGTCEVRAEGRDNPGQSTARLHLDHVALLDAPSQASLRAFLDLL
jgi:hypothetical protein